MRSIARPNCPEQLKDAWILHYIDSKPAMSCLLKGCSKKSDLNFIAGRVWFEAACLMSQYRAEYVKSSCNLADGPSRGKLELMLQLGAQELEWKFPSFQHGLGAWMSNPCEVDRMSV